MWLIPLIVPFRNPRSSRVVFVISNTIIRFISYLLTKSVRGWCGRFSCLWLTIASKTGALHCRCDGSSNWPSNSLSVHYIRRQEHSTLSGNLFTTTLTTSVATSLGLALVELNHEMLLALFLLTPYSLCQCFYDSISSAGKHAHTQTKKSR